MRELTMADFSPRLGKPFEISAYGAKLSLRLEAAQDLPSLGRTGGSFRLEFVGPFQPALPQATYPFRFGDEWVGIFIVPVGQDQRGIRYEAIFV